MAAYSTSVQTLRRGGSLHLFARLLIAIAIAV
jgi:hypothetical protein